MRRPDAFPGGKNWLSCRSDRRLEQLGNGDRELGTFAGPVVDALALDVDGGGAGAGVVGANHLDRATVAGAVLLNDNDTVIRLLAGAKARQSNHQHGEIFLSDPGCW
jgi:hypothetical protein